VENFASCGSVENFGFRLQLQDRYEEAIDAYCRAVAVEPSSINARSNMGQALLNCGRIEEAIETFRQVKDVAFVGGQDCRLNGNTCYGTLNDTLGFVLVIAVIFIYVVANLGVVRYYWREERSKFNWLLHGIFPIGTSAILIYSLYKSFSPAPARPYNWSPVIVAVWLLAGIGVLGYLRLRGSEDWLAKASAVVDDSADLEPVDSQPA